MGKKHQKVPEFNKKKPYPHCPTLPLRLIHILEINNIHNKFFLSTCHCEILGSYLQQPHQHHVSRAHFNAQPHSQAEGNT